MADLAAPGTGRLSDRMTRHRSLHPLLILATALGVAAGASEAQTILAIDYDTASGNYSYGFAYAGYGAAGGGNIDVSSGVTQFTEIAVAGGLSGSNALRIVADAAFAGTLLPPDRTYDYLGYALATNSGILQALPSAQLSDYTFMLSARAEGLLPGVTFTAVELYLGISAPDGTLNAPDGNGDFLVGLRFPTGVALSEAFETSVLNLADATVADGSLDNFTNFFSVANNITFSITNNESSGGGRFGFDAANVIAIDDVSLAVIPEPAGAACFALGACGLLARRRRPGRKVAPGFAKFDA